MVEKKRIIQKKAAEVEERHTGSLTRLENFEVFVPGTDVMISKIFSLKNCGKIGIFVQNFYTISIITLFFLRNVSFFSQKSKNLTKNNDHNIDPWNQTFC
jgi:hypothetical protein